MSIDLEGWFEALAASAAFDHHVHHAAVICYHWVEDHVLHVVTVGVSGIISYFRFRR